jgi:sulfatase modifying factor 1
MKRMHLFFSGLLLLAVIISACGGGEATTTAPPTDAPATDSTVATEVPATSAPLADASTPTQVSIDIAGPPMQVGSKFIYVDGSTLVAVPGGDFIMGYGGFDNPEHIVNISDFWIYRTKVTNQQFAACVAAGLCAAPDLTKNLAYNDPKRVNDPVVGVNWDQAQQYCSYVNGRLPTEAEWEKTARGPDGNIWPWGDQAPVCDLLNYRFCIGTTTDVTEYPEGQSYYEALDLAGNAFEWVADWYSPDYYGETTGQDPLGPDLGDKRSVRGSSFESGADASISAARYSLKPVESNKDLGFRCVVEDPLYFAPACQQLASYGEDAVTISGAPEGQSVINGCPVLSIGQGENCGPNNTPYTVVTFNPPPPTGVINPGACAATAVDNQFLCNSAETVSLTAACYVDIVGEPSCSAGYTFDPVTNTCKYSAQGTDGRCLPGTTYDPVNKCCTSSPGADASSSYPLCPVGQYYDATLNACFDIPTSGMISTSTVVSLKSCTPQQPRCDPAVDPNCQPTGQCPPGQTFVCVRNPQCSPTGGPCNFPDVCGCQ